MPLVPDHLRFTIFFAGGGLSDSKPRTITRDEREEKYVQFNFLVFIFLIYFLGSILLANVLNEGTGIGKEIGVVEVAAENEVNEGAEVKVANEKETVVIRTVVVEIVVVLIVAIVMIVMIGIIIRIDLKVRSFNAYLHLTHTYLQQGVTKTR